MNNLLTLLTCLFPSLALGETMDDLVITSGLYYKKFTDVPFTGKVTGKEQGKIRNGKIEGFWKTYWDNGQLMMKEIYKDGKRNGFWEEFKKDGAVDKGIQEGTKTERMSLTN